MDSKIQFRDASPHRHQRGHLHSTVSGGFEPSQQLYWFAEADDCSDDTAAPTVDRPQLGRSLEIAAYLARNRKMLWGGRRGRGNFVAASNRWSATVKELVYQAAMRAG
jgi:hypothetical protein